MTSIHLSPQRVLLWAKAMKMFAYYSTTVNFYCSSNEIIMRSINDFENAFVEVKFHKDSFVQFECEQPHDCKVAMTSLLMAFGGKNIHKSIDRCLVEIDPDIPQIRIQMKCRGMVMKSFEIPIIETNIGSRMRCPELSKRMPKPTLKVSPSVLLKMWDNVTWCKEITMWFYTNHVRLQNFVEKTDRNYFNTLITSYGISTREFTSYDAEEEFFVTFNLQDCLHFRSFASIHHNILSLYLQPDGEPCEIMFNNPMEHYSARLNIVGVAFNPDRQPEAPAVKMPDVDASQLSVALIDSTTDESLLLSQISDSHLIQSEVARQIRESNSPVLSTRISEVRPSISPEEMSDSPQPVSTLSNSQASLSVDSLSPLNHPSLPPSRPMTQSSSESSEPEQTKRIRHSILSPIPQDTGTINSNAVHFTPEESQLMELDMNESVQRMLSSQSQVPESSSTNNEFLDEDDEPEASQLDQIIGQLNSSFEIQPERDQHPEWNCFFQSSGEFRH